MMKEDADKRTVAKSGARRVEEIRLYVAPRRFVHRADIDDFRGTQPILIGGTMSITQLQVKL